MYAELSLIALKVVHSYMKSKPDYSQKKRENYGELINKLEEQLLLPVDDKKKDHDLIMDTRSKIKLQTELFYKEVRQ